MSRQEKKVSEVSTLLFVSNSRSVPVAYRRYPVNQIRAAYGFVGTPIRLVLKGKRAS